MAAQKKYPDELRERAVKMLFEVREREGKGRGELARVARQLGVHPEALRSWAKQALDALEMAIWVRRDEDLGGLVHHSDRGVQPGFKGSSLKERAGVKRGFGLRFRGRGAVCRAC